MKIAFQTKEATENKKAAKKSKLNPSGFIAAEQRVVSKSN